MRMFIRLLAILILAACPVAGWAQKKDLLKTDGYGSLSGKVTLAGVGPIPDPPNLAPMIAGQFGKQVNLVDNTWVIDKKTRAVANVVVWIKPPAKTYLVTHPNFKQRAEQLVIDIKDNNFFPRATLFNPAYFDGKKMIETGQTLSFKNNTKAAHNIKGIGNPLINPGFNIVAQAGDSVKLDAFIKPQQLPLSLVSDIFPWMRAEVYIFDHPYYTITKADGTYSIPFIPAGAEVSIMTHHAAVGYVVNGNKGKAITFAKDKKHTFDFQVNK